jgi:4-amino-4-deoxy-L-arabinose transferase-like glycosyltransferase
LSAKPKPVHWLLLVAILVVAAFLRVYRLQVLPRGPYYDEAANGILASEIATGRAYPLFIRSYTGKEVLWFYAVAAVMKVLGVELLSMRLTSAMFGIATVALTYWLGLELFDEEAPATRHGIGLMAAALAAVNFWHIVISRYGFRAISQPLLQALMLLFLWRGLRRGGSWDLVLAGLFCGATAYTYLSSRIVPVALLPWVIGTWIASRSQRLLVAKRILFFGLVAVAVFAPLGIFFALNPETFGARMSQVSVFNPDLSRGDVWRALWRSTGAALGMFTVHGDPQSRFGVIGRAVFDPLVGVFFYLGILYALVKIVRGKPTERVLYLSMLLWVPLLLVPSILGVKEVPHSLRAIGVMPVMFYLPALGLSAARRWLAARAAPLRWLASPAVSLVLAGTLLVEGGITAGWDYFRVWGSDPVPYYENDGDLADAARTLNEIDEGQEIWISSMHYRHPTMAFLAHSYLRARWLVDGQVIAFPPADGPGAVYVFTHLAFPDQSLLDLMDTVVVGERHLGPDGGLAYLVYKLQPGVVPDIEPQVPSSVNFGNQIELLGYDLPPIVAGESLYATFYWRVLGPPKADDYLLFAHLVDAWGLRWGNTDAFDYPSAEWQPGQIIVQRREVPVSTLTPPGDYELVAGFSSRGQNARMPRLDPQGRVAGTTVHVGPVSIARAPTPIEDRPRVQIRRESSFGDLHLLGFRRDQTSLRPGDVYYLGLYWASDKTLPDLDVVLTLASTVDGARVPLWSDRPVHGTYPTDEWPAGTVLLDQYGLTIPHDAPPGAYTLTLSALDRTSGQPVGDAVPLTELEIQEVDRRTIVPPIQHGRQANMGDQVEFLGYDLDRTRVAAGETLHLTLYWRALSEMETSYTVFTHLLDGANQIRGQQDNPPMGGTYPTTLWAPGEVVADEYALQVHADAQPGTHAIEIGLYVAATGQRLPVLDAAGQVTGDRILVSEVEVVDE